MVLDSEVEEEYVMDVGKEIVEEKGVGKEEVVVSV